MSITSVRTLRSRRRAVGRPRDDSLAERRREEILAAAAKHFARAGFARADLEELAVELGVGKGTLYRYFPTKRELFLAAVDRSMRALHAETSKAAERALDPLDQIAFAVRAYLEFFEAHPEVVELLILERAVFKDRKRPTYFEHRERHAGRWKALYRELIHSGRVRRMPVERITDVLSAAVYGTMFINHFNGRAKSPEEQSRDILDVVFHGIAAKAPLAKAPEAKSPGAKSLRRRA